MNLPRILRLAAFGLACLFLNSVATGQTPEWIWSDKNPPGDNDIRFFRREFSVDGPVAKAYLMASADNEVAVFLNGERVAVSRAWERPATADIGQKLKQGKNVIAAECRNRGGEAAFVARLTIDTGKGAPQIITTDGSWLFSATREPNYSLPGFDASKWQPAVSKGRLGVEPWGDVFAPRRATPVESLDTLPGFKVELVHSAEPGEGSWVAMTIDGKGRLIISPQEGVNNMLRVTLSPGGQVEKMESISQPIGGAMGLLWVGGDLYVNGKGADGLALYRLRDTNGDDQYDHLETLRKWKGDGGEHGPHGVVLGADNHLYVVCGNFVDVPDDLAPSSPHRNYADDLVLPRAEDGNGFGAGRKPPGGFVLRMDRDGGSAELFAAGQRNTYDIAFNQDGELFGFDSDMEWDWGTPWYRPIRVNHLVNGGDYGFREGSGKWPNWYHDSLPTTLDIGIGSPTGVTFGTGAKFPANYRDAFFIMDWTYGRIMAVHLKPKGATYEGSFENFVAPKSLRTGTGRVPLNVTDMVVGKDGALYFTTGGRGTQSGLYRVTYTGNDNLGGETPVDAAAAQARDLRHKLEAFHGKRDAGAVDFAWPHLDSNDRWIRYAARLAIESQPASEWRERALEETRVNASLTILLALARTGDRDLQRPILEKLGRLEPTGMSEAQILEALRVVEVLFARSGKPEEEIQEAVVDSLYELFPSRSEPLNREMSQILIYLEAPGIIDKTEKLIAEAPTQEEQLLYMSALRHMKRGWTLDQRRAFFGWFKHGRATLAHTGNTLAWFREAGRDYSDGASFPNFLKRLQSDALATLTDAERGELAAFIVNNAPARTQSLVVQRKFVREWKVEDLAGSLDGASSGRSFQSGKRAFADAQCLACHRFGNEGGAIGPDLTAIASRFSRADILSSILEPSKVISEQYQNIVITKKDGDDVIGRLVEEDKEHIVLLVNPLTGDKATVAVADIQKRAASKFSPMPQGLVDILSKEEILDLIAYLESGGKPTANAFKGRN